MLRFLSAPLAAQTIPAWVYTVMFGGIAPSASTTGGVFLRFGIWHEATDTITELWTAGGASKCLRWRPIGPDTTCIGPLASSRQAPTVILDIPE